MVTQKWHALDHICDAIRDIDDITDLHAGRFESVHKRFAKAFCFSSKMARGVMSKVIDKENRQIVTGSHISKKQEQPHRPVHQDYWQKFLTEFIWWIRAMCNIWQRCAGCAETKLLFRLFRKFQWLQNDTYCQSKILCRLIVTASGTLWTY